jgi:hypothetical protein
MNHKQGGRSVAPGCTFEDRGQLRGGGREPHLPAHVNGHPACIAALDMASEAPRLPPPFGPALGQGGELLTLPVLAVDGT